MMCRFTILMTMGLLTGCSGDSASRDGGCRPQPTCTTDTCIGGTIGEFGDPCQGAMECKSGLCGQDSQSGARFCTSTCNPGDLQPCLYSAACLLAGDGVSHVCGPPVDC